MGYRFEDKPPKPEDMLMRLSVRNGAVLRTTFSCFYLAPKPKHNPKFHDHIGWPQPTRPDDSCQMMPPMHYVKGTPCFVLNHPDDLVPIHLTEEGYDKTSVVFDDDSIAEYLSGNTWIDDEDDNIVHLTVDTFLPVFFDKPKETTFTVFAKNGSIKDAVFHGILTVLPGKPYEE